MENKRNTLECFSVSKLTLQLYLSGKGAIVFNEKNGPEQKN